MLTPLLSQAQDEEETEPKLVLSGSVDAYFRYNLTAKNDGEGYVAPGTSFANLPGFSLGMINVIAAYEGKKTGFVADLVYGPRGEDAVFASPYYNAGRGSSQIVNQLYVYWKATDAVTFSLGNFNTFLGYEVISPAGNFNYSTSYMFSYGPFSHTGVKADIALSDEWSVMAAIMNPTDLTEFNPFGSFTLGGQLGYSNDKTSAYLNVLYGDQDGKIDEDQPGSTSIDGFSSGNTFQIDLTGGTNLSEAFYLGFNATYNSTSDGEFYNGTDISDVDSDAAGFYGAAAYLQLTTSEKFAIGTRIEYFKVYNNGLGVIALDDEGDGNVLDITLTGRATIGNLTFIPELRLDTTSEDGSFLDNDLEASKSLASFVLAAVFSF
jgi:hypothetical protein